MGGVPCGQKGLRKCRRGPCHETIPLHAVVHLIDLYPLIGHDHDENSDRLVAHSGVVVKKNTACPGGEVADGVL